MNIGEKLYELRKEKHLSQEEVAEKLDVTRQTISKWETNQSTPDFDKIKPLCELYEITADELLTGERKEKTNQSENKQNIKEKRAKGIALGVLTYFVAVVWIMISIPVLLINPITGAGIFLLICGIATFIIIYTCISYKKEKEEKEKNPIIKRINNIIQIISFIIYMLVSFLTMAWHITWIIFVICGLLEEIVKLIFELRGENNEE
jgi:transcriptional regulator with XRE-family HTH domain